MEEEVGSTPDEKLRASVLAALAGEIGTASLDLRVGVLHGIVHLAGAAPSLEARMQAERIATGVINVRGVVNRIEAPGAPSPARIIHLNSKPIPPHGEEK